ncbi:MAG: hypothetical protein MUE53_08300 [Chitinophagales bacterium]|jgi:hypothetical protein|nr:hypothetical protein [Chitinophagales bacterium]
MKSIYLYFFSSILLLSACGDSQNVTQEFNENWQMDEVFRDQSKELNENGDYCVYTYFNDAPVKDSLSKDEDITSEMIAILISRDEMHQSALVYIDDSAHLLKLKESDTKDKNKIIATYVDDSYEVSLKLNFIQRIKDYEEIEDLLIFRGKMKVAHKKAGNAQEFRIEGGC